MGGEGASCSAIYVVDAGGGEARALTPASFGDCAFDPSFSPDGRTVLYARSLREPTVGRRVDLYTVPITGGAPTLLTDTPTFNEDEPVWSPDGTKIAFAGIQHTEGNPEPYCGQGLPHLTCDVYVINADGTGRQQLTSSAGDDYQPSWQPTPGPRRADYKNGSQFCRAERDFLGDSGFREKYGGGSNAHGRQLAK